MIWVGNGLKARTRVSWYFAVFLILTSLLSILVRVQGFSLIYFDIIGISANILMLFLLIKYRKEYIFPSRTIYLPVEGKVALAAISVAVIYGVAGTLFLGNQFNPPVQDLYTAIYYSSVVLTTIVRRYFTGNEYGAIIYNICCGAGYRFVSGSYNNIYRTRVAAKDE